MCTLHDDLSLVTAIHGIISPLYPLTRRKKTAPDSFKEFCKTLYDKCSWALKAVSLWYSSDRSTENQFLETEAEDLREEVNQIIIDNCVHRDKLNTSIYLQEEVQERTTEYAAYREALLED